ncbi:MAG: hypothetical protein KF863_21420 [Rubrivivax sp.]|nr:hypothetical protein [Rubrivivax sp.]
MLLVSAILSQVRVTLLDPNGSTWGDAELLGYFNEFQRTTAFLKPDAHTVRDYIPLEAGINQELPEDGIAVFEIGENEVSGRMATLVDRGLLDHANRFWPAATQEPDVQHWSADPRDPRRFAVMPPNDGTGSIECLYGAVPPAATLGDAPDGAMAFPDSYEHAAKCFVMAKAYAKNSKRQDPAKSAAYMADYRQALGIKTTSQAASAPRVRTAAQAD